LHRDPAVFAWIENLRRVEACSARIYEPHRYAAIALAAVTAVHPIALARAGDDSNPSAASATAIAGLPVDSVVWQARFARWVESALVREQVEQAAVEPPELAPDSRKTGWCSARSGPTCLPLPVRR